MGRLPHGRVARMPTGTQSKPEESAKGVKLIFDLTCNGEIEPSPRFGASLIPAEPSRDLSSPNAICQRAAPFPKGWDAFESET